MHPYPKFPPPTDFGPEPHWTHIQTPIGHTMGKSFIEGDPEGQRLRIMLYVDEAQQRLFARVWFGGEAEGPPGHAHGGSMAAVLDHVMGVGSWVAGHPVVAARIGVEFRNKLPLGKVITAEAWVDTVDGRKVHTRGRLYLDDPDKPFAESDGLFIKQPIERFKALMEEAAAATDYGVPDSAQSP